jgi:Family of unknown function (DUF6786)
VLECHPCTVGFVPYTEGKVLGLGRRTFELICRLHNQGDGDGERTMLDRLREHDPHLVELPSDAGGILVAPGLQGRVFCRMGGELVHRLDVDLLDNPSASEFNNLGGNSLWPAPEGGDCAFNYLPGSDEWVVQPGIAEANCVVTSCDPSRVCIEKDIALTNRKGIEVRLMFRRVVSPVCVGGLIDGFTIQAVAYSCEDTFAPHADYPVDSLLIAPWSLEQFPGADGIIAFGKADCPEDAVNTDFYGSPGERLTYGEDFFQFRLGGEDRHQIGIDAHHHPRFLGALDSKRSMLFIRKTPPQEGLYFNIADNDQPDGPSSASDMYSLFNGGSLNFFELETIAPMQVRDGCLAESTLVSETLILKGSVDELKRYLVHREGLVLEENAS